MLSGVVETTFKFGTANIGIVFGTAKRKMRKFAEMITIMTEREQLAEEIEGLGDGLTIGGFTITDLNEVSLRKYCVEKIISTGLLSRDINETVRRADTLYRYISNGETDTK